MSRPGTSRTYTLESVGCGAVSRVYFDGSPRIVSGTSFTLQEVWRGVHNLQAEVLDENGQMLIRSQTNRFYVQQSTVF